MKNIYLTIVLALSVNGLFAQIQFASYLIDYSSEYYSTDSGCNNSWAACQILGAPNVYPDWGDEGGAWASGAPDDQREFIAVGFATPTVVDTIYIYETHNPGAIDTVYVRNAVTQAWQIVWSDTAYDINDTARLFRVPTNVVYTIDGVRLALNSPVVVGYNEIDAISLNDFALGVESSNASTVSVNVYPNPSTGHFTVEAGNALVETISIKDVTGREVYSLVVNATRAKIDRTLAAGVYMVEAKGKGFRKSVKLVME